MKKLVIATQNRDKFREMKNALEGLDWELIPAFEFSGAPTVEEDGQTLKENSLKKAEVLSRFTGLAALADDTGLFIDALDGQPGIYAARFAGENCSYEDNVQKVLALLKGLTGDNRRAVFRTAITLFHPDQPPQQVVGEAEGFITEVARGQGGFGYDPIFLPAGFSKVFAEMSLEEKNKISHRGKAVQKARLLLEK
ncbi:MAG TPA: RdgB/HAM1 family non-canonical purine NTP pyrophosphatase [bacterium]